MGAAKGISDIAIMGGGLAGGLIALALQRWRPDLAVTLIERDTQCGGNHVWSFFATDLTGDGEALVDPLVVAGWQDYEVRFPGHRRILQTPYAAATSERLDAVLRRTLPPGALLTGATVASCDADGVHLADGRTLAARSIIDARGIDDYGSLTGGWQKFLGQRLKLAAPHGLTRPMVMDATVAQADGYRFVYCLPFAPDEVFVEDTYYADGPALDRDVLGWRIADYARARGWTVLGVIGEEHGVLPVVAGGRPAPWRSAVAVPAGARAGLFHPLTSYSLPDALRFALALARWSHLGRGNLHAFCQSYASNHWNTNKYYRMLSALLFAAADPANRYRVLERFYRLDRRLIERFYAGRSTLADKARILAGKPPVSISRALGVLTGLGARPALIGERHDR